MLFRDSLLQRREVGRTADGLRGRPITVWVMKVRMVARVGMMVVMEEFTLWT